MDFIVTAGKRLSVAGEGAQRVRISLQLVRRSAVA